MMFQITSEEWTQHQYFQRIIQEYIIDCDMEVMWSTWNGVDHSGPIRACVTCSDTFAFACADAETIEPEDIDELIAFAKEGEKNKTHMGDIIWCCKKRNRRTLKAYWAREKRDKNKYGYQSQFEVWMNQVVPLTDETRGVGE